VPVSSRRATYVSLLIFAIAFGWIEGCVVVYLREVYLKEAATGASGLQLPITAVALPLWTVRVELVRETCTMVVLASVGWLASRRTAGRWGAFLIGFGVWDLMYYVTLWLLLGWPESLATWDILFLIPVPWVAPVWAPVVVASTFVATGSWLLLTDERTRSWRAGDLAGIAAGAAIIVGSFLVESRAAVEHYVPERYAWWIYWPGFLLAVGAFVHAERSARRTGVT
jgi:hypothetical protein